MIVPIVQDATAPARVNRPLIDTMASLKGDIIYADRSSPFFLIVVGNKFYMGHPAYEGGLPGDDQPYTGGAFTDCSTAKLSCKAAGAHIFVRSKSGSRPVSFYDRTAVIAGGDADSGWWGSGSWTYQSANMPIGHDGRPNVAYQYSVNTAGVVTRILVSYWSAGSKEPVIHELKLETERGIQL